MWNTETLNISYATILLTTLSSGVFITCMLIANNIRTQQIEEQLHDILGNGQTYNKNHYTSIRNELESVNANLKVTFWYINVRSAHHGL